MAEHGHGPAINGTEARLDVLLRQMEEVAGSLRELVASKSGSRKAGPPPSGESKEIEIREPAPKRAAPVQEKRKATTRRR